MFYPISNSVGYITSKKKLKIHIYFETAKLVCRFDVHILENILFCTVYIMNIILCIINLYFLRNIEWYFKLFINKLWYIYLNRLIRKSRNIWQIKIF